MLERLVTFALHQRVFVLVLTAALIGFGLRALDNLPIEAFPDVQDVQVQVVTQFPGQAPEEVERAISLPIEREMSGVPRLTQLRSVSITGLSVVTLTFADRTDDYFARQQVLEKLQTVNLPAGVQPALAPLSTAVGEIYRYVLESPPEMPSYEVRAVQDWIVRPALRMVPGVADIVSFGGSVKEYQVLVDPHALRKYGVTLDQVSQAVGANGANAGGGLLRRGDEALVIRSIGLYARLEDIRGAVIAARNGRPILASDVAEVDIGPRPLSGVVAFNERDSIVEGIVQMTKGNDAAKVVADLKARIADVTAKLPPGVSLRPDLRAHPAHPSHRGDGSRESHAGCRAGDRHPDRLPAELARGADRRQRHPAGAARRLHPDGRARRVGQPDLARRRGFRHHHRQRRGAGRGADGAARGGNRQPGLRAPHWRRCRQTVVELGHPILFSKAIIITAFLPIFTFQRVEGKIFAPVALTLSFALAGALLLTLTLVPALLSYAVRKDRMAETHSAWLARLQDRYRGLLARVFAASPPRAAGVARRSRRGARGRAAARHRIPAQAGRGQHLADHHPAVGDRAGDAPGSGARSARDPAVVRRSRRGDHPGRASGRRHRSEGAQQP